ncbi:hypothetical protein KUCAC02_018307 [Chaenocephalus aceratus]|uniref:Uncharacterized protein n=1 Tax=Chaenocephalus aceratus TaxID=36190 RepID=A0ACB9W9W6_CHAAC|nr:hypothetical protein KUCAC02_018307 [Chaenocephalus aceratus]
MHRPIFWTRLAAVIFSCVAFSVAVHGGQLSHGTGDWCIFCWAFGFGRVPPRHPGGALRPADQSPCVLEETSPLPSPATPPLFCLSASILFLSIISRAPLAKAKPATTASCRPSSPAWPTIAYISEVSMSKARPGEVAGYMATRSRPPESLRDLCGLHHLRLRQRPRDLRPSRRNSKYCMSVYCICFILSAVIILLCIGECNRLPSLPFARFLSSYALLAVVLYLSATIIWPIFNFDSKNGGTKNRPNNCSNATWPCLCSRRSTSSFTLVDLIYSSRLVFVNA